MVTKVTTANREQW